LPALASDDLQIYCILSSHFAVRPDSILRNVRKTRVAAETVAKKLGDYSMILFAPLADC